MFRRLTLRALEATFVAAALSVCLFPLWAENDGAAKVVSLLGQVSVLRDSSPWALNVGDSVQPAQIIITGADGFAKFQLSDGSTFEVFPNSRTIFRKSPSNWKDLLDVIIGRVKVHIQKIGGQPNFNQVHTPTAVISVRGTTFDVSVDDDDTTLVSVEEGEVGVRHALMPSGEKSLHPGESITVYKNQPIAKKIDRGSAAQTALRAAAQALYELIYRTPRGAAGGATSAGGSAPLPTDTNGKQGGGDAPAPPPPPPPPPQ